MPLSDESSSYYENDNGEQLFSAIMSMQAILQHEICVLNDVCVCVAKRKLDTICACH